MRKKTPFTPHRLLCLALCSSVFAAGPAADAEQTVLQGEAVVVDGDTLRMHGERIRLEGIDAPESGQSCRNGNEEAYPCGEQATQALVDLIAGHSVTCKSDERDQWDRLISFCEVEGEDLNAWLVEQGHAIAVERFSKAYVRHEQRARKARRGIWKGRFVEPWKWRQGERLD